MGTLHFHFLILYKGEVIIDFGLLEIARSLQAFLAILENHLKFLDIL